MKLKLEAVSEALNAALRIVLLNVAYEGSRILHVVENDSFGGAAEGYDSNVSEAVFSLPEGLAVKREEG